MRSVAIITGPNTHLDHLGILSAELKIPLIVTEEGTFQLAKRFYPDLDVSLKGFDELSMEYLAQNFDVIFETGKFWAAELGPFIELLFRKKMRFVFCPHGNSDKGHSLQNHVDQDISLVYGEHLHDHLIRTGAAQKIRHVLRTGNYRYPYYLRHRVFYDALADELVFRRFQDLKPTLLYAPTWQDEENPTSFFSATDALIEQLSPNYNLIVKIHPFLADRHPAEVYQVTARYENHPSVLFLNDFPPIYPLLSHCALYLGDYSSIGYDFLAFDKPLYFLNPKKAPSSSPLYGCGLEIPESAWNELNQFLMSTMERNIREFAIHRKKIYDYAFGEELSPEILRLRIFEANQ
jgi:hypothetical protein